MFDISQIEELRKLADKSMNQLQKEINIFDMQLAKNIEIAPQEDKALMEECRTMVQRAIALAKMGKAEESAELIHNFQKSQDASKSNK